jgi:ABC-type multidrug transport system fused ATPase/permease subunit
MGPLFAIFLHLIILFILSFVIALFCGLIAMFVCNKEKRKRKIFLAFFTPFQAIFTLYFSALIGIMIVSEIKNVDAGIGDAWYAPLNESCQVLMIDLPEQAYIVCGETTLVSDVSHIQQEEDKIYGKTYEDKYFSLNLENSKLNEYLSENELIQTEKIKKLHLRETLDFYQKQKWEVSGTLTILAGILSVLISIGSVLLFCRLVLHGFKFGLNK